MSRALLLDEMINPRVPEGLRSRGVDVLAIAAEPELRTLPDLTVLELAASQQRILVTLNIKDFQQLHRAWATSGREHAGLVFVTHARFPLDGGTIGRLITELEKVADGSRPDTPAPGEMCFL